ncbi:BRI1 kinase inhibitor 1-like [Abrus precatorius]|uniref:BRI1 kinase inhibitor 1-like n=1 Tax=Abrus precatorius TaxID=3816 RepID=A0A8B8LIT2_ABRPR|nr:BRI1 kinase inhibitor 1-like [Abrus precatorius]
METHLPQKNTENDVEKQQTEGEAKQQPPSPSSSPSHEFSFTISLHSSNTTIHDKSKAPPSLAVDLTPADDIFFHGHLLPLHLLSHFSSSPRFSTNSMDSFTLPIREFLEDEKKPTKDSGSCNSSNRSNITIDSISNCNSNSIINKEEYYNNRGTKEESKSKPTFSLFGLTKGRKGCQVRDKEDKENKHKKNLGYDVIHALKKYLRMVQPLVLFRGKREKVRFHGQAYSHSGNLIRRNKPELRGRRGEYSAPASMRTSPTNSGLLLATATLPPANDSTMEELQAAIQAAIAHCKNSIAKEEKLNC